MRTALKAARAERIQRFTAAEALHRPLLDFYKSLYTKNSAAARAYGAETARTAKRLARQASSMGGHGRPVPAIDWTTVPFFGPFQNLVLVQPCDSIPLYESKSGTAKVTYPDNVPLENMLGCWIKILGPGAATVAQMATNSFYSQDSGTTMALVTFNPQGSVYLDGLANIGRAFCAIQVQVFEGDATSTTLVSYDDDPFIYFEQLTVGPPPSTTWTIGSTIGALFVRQPATQYSIRVTALFEADCGHSEPLPCVVQVFQQVALSLSVALTP